jgi:rRNA-processing protein FCF1
VELLRFICADPRYKTVPVIVLSTNSIMDTSDDHVLERANKRLLKGSCTPAIMLQVIQELFADGTPSTEPKAGTVTPDRHVPV